MSRDIFCDFEAAKHYARRAFDAEDLCRALMTAGLDAVGQARLEEREACLAIVERFRGQSVFTDGAAASIRARGRP